MREFTVDENEWLTLRAMKTFQIIELFLKFYLTHKPDLTWKASYKGSLPDYSSEQVDGWSLACLVSKFREHTDNVALCDRLKAAAADRNTIAHRSLIGTSEATIALLGIGKQLTLTDLRRIDKSAMKLMSDLTVECISKLGRSTPNPPALKSVRRIAAKKASKS